MIWSFVRSSLLAGLAVGVLPAQDPPVPPGGFPIAQTLNQLYTYGDGYRTRYDVRMPDPAQVTPPAGGWPVVLLIHGFPGARGFFAITGEGPSLAARGYITVAYDVRGQGETRTLNPTNRGTTLVGRLEIGDMAEMFHAIEGVLGSQMDFDRLAVAGTSQGGDHSFAAAGWSERQMPQARGSITHFPKISAIQPRASNANLADLWNPDGNAFAGVFTRNWFNTPAILDPTMESELRTLFLNQDFAGLTAFTTTDPWRQASQLSSSSVPTLYMGAFDDFSFPQNEPIDRLNSMPASTPTFAYLTTGYHQTVPNNLETSQQFLMTQRWLDRFLKGAADDLDQQRKYLMVGVPASSAEANDPASIWTLRQQAAFPDTGETANTTLYLRSGSTLSSFAPTTNEPVDTVTHAVPPGFAPLDWVATNNDTTQVFAQIPLSTTLYRGAPLAADLEIIGKPAARLHIDSPAPNLQLHVALFDENPQGERRYISGGYRALRGRTPGVSVLDVDFRLLSYTVPAGNRIAIQVENHTWHRPLGISQLRTVPYFESYQFDCLHTTTEASWIQLPTRTPALGCRADTVGLSVANGGSVGVVIDGAPQRAGSTYAVLVSLSGAAPGFPFRGVNVPVNLDLLSGLGLQLPNTLPYTNFLGTLDSAGQTTAAFTTGAAQLPPQAFGFLLTFGAITFELTGGFSASAPSQVRFEL